MVVDIGDERLRAGDEPHRQRYGVRDSKEDTAEVDPKAGDFVGF